MGISKLVLDRNDPMGSIKILQLPAGEYAFDRFFVSGTTLSVYSNPGFRIPFTVKPDQVNYIGNINFDFTALPAIGAAVFDDQATRDIALFRERHANLTEVPLSSAVEAASGADSPKDSAAHQ